MLSKKRLYLVETGMIAVYFIQCIIMINRILEERNLLKVYNAKTKKLAWSNQLAKPLSQLISGCGIELLLFLFGMVSLVAAVWLLQYYQGSHSIYTILRLPQKRSSLYVGWIKQSVTYLAMIWVIQFVCLLFYDGIYNARIPAQCIGTEAVYSIWQDPKVAYFYPVHTPLLIIRPILLCVLCPALVLTITIVIKSGRGCILGMITTALAVIGLIAASYQMTGDIVILLLAVLDVIGTGVYYLKHVKIV